MCLAWLANGAVIPSLNNATAELEARNSVNGYRSVAYFVNWVSLLPDIMTQLTTMLDGLRRSTAATTSPNSSLLRL